MVSQTIMKPFLRAPCLPNWANSLVQPPNRGQAHAPHYTDQLVYKWRWQLLGYIIYEMAPLEVYMACLETDLAYLRYGKTGIKTSMMSSWVNFVSLFSRFHCPSIFLSLNFKHRIPKALRTLCPMSHTNFKNERFSPILASKPEGDDPTGTPVATESPHDTLFVPRPISRPNERKLNRKICEQDFRCNRPINGDVWNYIPDWVHDSWRSSKSIPGVCGDISFPARNS